MAVKPHLVFVALLALLTALPARADVALPMSTYLIGALPLALPLLIPVILVETWVVRLLLKDSGYKLWALLLQVASVNVATTLIGLSLLSSNSRAPEPEALFVFQFMVTILIEAALLMPFYHKPERKRSFGQLTKVSALMNLPSYLGLFLLLFFLYETTPRRWSIKPNMFTLQTMVETYAVDWGGYFPASMAALEYEAKVPGREYWKELTWAQPRKFFHPEPPRIPMVLAPGESPRPDSMIYRPKLNKKGLVCSYEILAYDYRIRPVQEQKKTLILHGESCSEP